MDSSSLKAMRGRLEDAFRRNAAEALVCAGVTLKAVATALDFRLNGATVAAEGDLDFRGTLGVSNEASRRFPRDTAAFRPSDRRAAGSASTSSSS